MTELRGATVADFKEALKMMHKVYPYVDEETKVVSTQSYYDKGNHLEIYTIDKNTGVEITMNKRIHMPRLGGEHD